MVRTILFALLLPALAYAGHRLAVIGAEAVERALATQIAEGFEVLDLDWASAEVDGLRIEVVGHAPDRAAQTLAIESARGIGRHAVVVDGTTATLAPPPERDPILIEIHKTADRLTLTGRVHTPGMRDDIVGALAARMPEWEIHDLTGANAAKPPEGWGPELEVGLLAVREVQNAFLRIAPGSVAVEGVAATQAEREAIEARLARRAAERISLSVALTAPLSVIAPFRFRASLAAGDRPSVEECAARSEADIAAISATLAELGRPEAPDCRIGLGGPDAPWADAVSAGLLALDSLGGGALELEYGMVHLEAGADVPTTRVEAAEALLEARLPEGFILASAPAWETPLAEAERDKDRYWLHLVRDGGPLLLRGLVSGVPDLWALRTYATAMLGRDGIENELSASDGPAPKGWQGAALVAIDAVSDLDRGEARLAGTEVVVSGKVTTPEEAARLQRQLHEQVPNGWVARSEIIVDLPTAVALAPISVPRCAVLLNAIVSTKALTFQSGSADLSAISAPEIDALAEVLSGCMPGLIEIGGHTDSRGREAFNQQLSQARAEAVRLALIARGISPDRLVARGYGEAEPIASNRTEEGRARNRRIAFALPGPP